MFTGFASENTPSIQAHDFFQSLASAGALTSVALADDCAPIQYFRTGGTASQPIRIYLPTSPVDGKRITIINAAVGSARQYIWLFTSDATTLFNETGTQTPLLIIGQGQTIDLCYFKQLVGSTGSNSVRTGWITLNQMSPSVANSGSVTLGGSQNASTAAFSSVFGGNSSTASGSYAAVVGGQSNTASGDRAIVLGATSSTANNTQSIVVGGESNSSQGFRSAVIGGNSNNVSGNNSITLGCNNSTANSNNSSVLGGSYGSTRSIVGYTVFPGTSTIAVSSGVTQTALSVLGKQTTDATSVILTSQGGGASTTNQVILPNNSAYTFQGTVIANVTGGGNTSAWKFEGAIKRGASAATTALVAAVTPTVIAQDVGAVTWVLAITADTTNGGIAVTVTGAAATTIRWVCKIETTEVTF